MTGARHDSGSTAMVVTIGRLAEGAHFQAIEGNPWSADESGMFEKFGREGWSSERRWADIARREAKSQKITPAACLRQRRYRGFRIQT